MCWYPYGVRRELISWGLKLFSASFSIDENYFTPEEDENESETNQNQEPQTQSQATTIGTRR